MEGLAFRVHLLGETLRQPKITYEWAYATTGKSIFQSATYLPLGGFRAVEWFRGGVLGSRA